MFMTSRRLEYTSTLYAHSVAPRQSLHHRTCRQSTALRWNKLVPGEAPHHPFLLADRRGVFVLCAMVRAALFHAIFLGVGAAG